MSVNYSVLYVEVFHNLFPLISLSLTTGMNTIKTPLGVVGLVVVTGILIYIFFVTGWVQSIGTTLKQVTTASSTTYQADSTHSTSTPQYIEIMDGCSPYFVGTCVNMREGAGASYPVHTRLRTGVVLKVGGVVNVNGQDWYKIAFAAKLVHPERITTDLYVASGDYLRLFSDDGDEYATPGVRATSTTKRIVVDASEQMLYAYDGDVLFMKEPISTGLEFTPTPRGTFTIFKKTPARYMQGPIPGGSDQSYDLPGVPWDLYFTTGGAVIHGAYWHDHFGKPWSHGCVNLSPENAKKLYYWADIGMSVTVQN
jgi:lipoprotein-anchoring transpeptidase ErfK/SrfK